MMTIGIPDDYADMVRTLPSFRKVAGHPLTIWTDAAHDVDELADRLKDVEALVLIRERTPISAPLLARLPKLRMITISGPYPNVDLAACNAHGVMVCASANRPTLATPELTWALVMAATRRIPQEVERLKSGGWQGRIGGMLHNRTLGVAGFGRIGKVVAGYGRAFGMRVLVWSRERGQDEARTLGYEVATSKVALFTEADVLTLHLRLTRETRGFVTRGDLAHMKPDALLVNTSRAELVEPGALVDALRAGRPGSAAVDVFEHEPVLGANDPLLQLPNALCTPHLGFVAREPMDEYFTDQFERVLAFERGAPINVVNAEAIAKADNRG
jgi:D-3-phosphoglycerate dehydrogenase / 2-oxoglutarate reductase